MAAFREHVTFSTVLGVGFAVGLKALGWEPGPALLAGGLCGLAGMFPDLDSDSGKPVRPKWQPLYAHQGRRMESWSKFISDAYWSVELK